MQPHGRTLRRRALGAELRRYRTAAGISVRGLAPLAKLQPGTISKIENGRQAILPKNVLLILQALGAPADDVARLVAMAGAEEREAWWQQYADSVPTWFQDYVDLEGDAAEISTYAPELVDGLLQTPAYADAVARVTEPGFTEEQLRRGVALREARQARLTQEDPPRLHVVLNEAAVRRGFGSPETMRGQLRRLAEMTEHPSVTIQVLPFSAGGHPAVKGGFTVLRFPAEVADADSVYIETEMDGVWLDRPEDVSRYAAVFTRVSEMALPVSETRDFLSTLAR